MAGGTGEGNALSLLGKLVGIDSVFPHEAALAGFCRDELSRAGFEAALFEYSPGRFNVVAQKGKREGALLLTAHLDTVPPYNYGGRDPFSLERKEGKLFGLGAYDMKSGLALVLRCASECAPGRRGLRIVFTSDEENISEGTWAAKNRGDFSNCSGAVCHEIADAADGGRGPDRRPPIILGRRGRCVYRFDVSGIGAHAAGTGGVSALSLAMDLARALERIPMPQGRIGQCRLFLRKMESESRSLAVPTEAMLEADVHYVPPYTKEGFLAYIKQELAGQGFSVPAGCSWKVSIPGRKTPYLEAYETRENEPFAQEFLASYGKNIGKPSLSYGLTVADENVLGSEGMPVITVGLDGGEAHSAQEWVSENDYLLLWERMPKVVQELLD